MMRLIILVALFLSAFNVAAETVACIATGHIFIKDNEAETAKYKSDKTSENIRLFQFSESDKEFTVDWNISNKIETHKLIGETGAGWKIYLGGIDNLNVVTVNKDKTQIHWLQTDGGSTTPLSCTN